MAFEIPIDLDYFEHPKTLALLAILGPHSDVFPLRLWAWCAKYAKSGHIRGGREQIEIAVKWSGEKGALHKALVKCGFLEKDGKTVHDWMDFTGRAIHLYEQKKARQRQRWNASDRPEDHRQITGRSPAILDTQDNQDDRDEKPGKPTSAKPLRPTLEEVVLYCQERKNSVNPQGWFDYYTANGWRVGKNPMRDWKASVRTWERNNFQGNGSQISREEFLRTGMGENNA